jgi:hypothetical protein
MKLNKTKKKLRVLKKAAGNVSKVVNLNTPLGCREFMNDVRLDGKRVTHFRLNGERYAIADLCDDEIMQVTADFYHEFFSGRGPIHKKTKGSDG